MTFVRASGPLRGVRSRRHGRERRRFGWTLALLLVLLLAAPAWADERRSPGGHVVEHPAVLADEAGQVVSMLPRIRREVRDQTGLDAGPAPARVVLARDLEGMREAAKAAVPDWVAGLCVGSRGLVVLRLDVIEAGRPHRTLETVLRHEWVHLAWSRTAGVRARRMPRWFEEGLAEDVGGGISVGGAAQLDLAASFGNLIPFDDISSTWPSGADRAALAYRQSRSLVRYIAAEAGMDALRATIAALHAGGRASETPRMALDAALGEATSRSLSQWDAAWQVHVREEARPWFHLLGRDLWTTTVLVVALGAVLGWFVVRRRRRRQLAQMEAEERGAHG